MHVRHGSRCRSVCERARGSGAGRGLIQRSCLAPERTAPDRLSSTPGTLPTTAGDWPTACQSALAPPPCPMRMQKHRRAGHFFFFFLFKPLCLKTETHEKQDTHLRGYTKFLGDLKFVDYLF